MVTEADTGREDKEDMYDDLIQGLTEMDKDSLLILLVRQYERCRCVILEEDKKNLSLEYSPDTVVLVCKHINFKHVKNYERVSILVVVHTLGGVSLNGRHYPSFENEEWLRKQLVIHQRGKKISKLL